MPQKHTVNYIPFQIDLPYNEEKPRYLSVYNPVTNLDGKNKKSYSVYVPVELLPKSILPHLTPKQIGPANQVKLKSLHPPEVGVIQGFLRSHKFTGSKAGFYLSEKLQLIKARNLCEDYIFRHKDVRVYGTINFLNTEFPFPIKVAFSFEAIDIIV